jgi:hypothetical protein
MHATQKPAAPLATTSVGQLLNRAADYLDQYGWCQESHYADDTPNPPADLVGAVAIAHYGYPTPDLIIDIDLDSIADTDPMLVHALSVLGDFIGIHDMVDAHGHPVPYTLTDWNDEPYMSVGCVTAVLRAAADDHEHTGGVA